MHTVLVVDDEVHIQRMLERRLEKENYIVLSASDADEAIKIIRASDVD